MHIPECMALFHSSVQKSSPHSSFPLGPTTQSAPQHTVGAAVSAAQVQSLMSALPTPVLSRCCPYLPDESQVSGSVPLQGCLHSSSSLLLLSAFPPALAWDGLLQNAPHENPYHHVFHNAPENNWFCYSLSPLDCF